MFDQFRSQRARLRFVVFVAALTLVLAVGLGSLTFARSDERSSGGSRFLDALGALSELVLASVIGGALTAGFVVLLFGYLYRDDDELDSVEIAEPSRTQQLHKESLASSDFWYHNGHIGRWVRNHVLDEFDRAAGSRGNRRGHPHHVVFMVLDPRRDDLCKKYSDYRDVLAPTARRVGGLDDVKLEILATAIKGASMKSSRLRVEMYFRDLIDYSRLDINNRFAFHTLADSASIAVAYVNQESSNRHSFYDVAKVSFENTMGDAEQLPLAAAALPSPLSRDGLTDDAITAFLVDNNLAGLIAPHRFGALRDILFPSTGP